MTSHAVNELADAVCATRQLLSAHGDIHTVQRLLDIETKLRAEDTTAIVSAISEATGGMGSLNDRFLSPKNGDAIDARDVTVMNRRLTHLVRAIEEKARAAAVACGVKLIR